MILIATLKIFKRMAVKIRRDLYRRLIKTIIAIRVRI